MKFISKTDSLRIVSENLFSSGMVKATLGSYQGDEDLKNIYLKPVLIKGEVKISLTYRYHRKDIVKNLYLEDAVSLVLRMIEHGDFNSVSIFGQYENVFLQLHPKKGWGWRKESVKGSVSKDLSHDKKKARKLHDFTKTYLNDLGLTDSEGKVYKNAQDKWKQINHYIEILSSMLEDLPEKEVLHVVDMGAGKGYLTFALYDYLVNNLNRKVDAVGVEYRQDLVDFCNQVSKNAGFEGLNFVQGTIDSYTRPQKQDILIALHACDTATDDAIYKGIEYESDLIVVAPCCHKQVRREIERNKPANDLDFVTKYGVFLERHAEMLTDAIRALILEYFGYQTKVLEFVSDAHTPKNVLIVGVKKAVDTRKQELIMQKLAALKSYFGLNYHHLERLTGLG